MSEPGIIRLLIGKYISNASSWYLNYYSEKKCGKRSKRQNYYNKSFQFHQNTKKIVNSRVSGVFLKDELFRTSGKLCDSILKTNS